MNGSRRCGTQWNTTQQKKKQKKNKIMSFAATWMKLEVITLSEVSQTEKDKYHMTSLICGIKNMTKMNLS